MRVQCYDAHAGVLQITIATPRPEALPSTQFAAASIHEDYVAKVRAALREFKHCGESSQQVPVAKRLQNYFPQHGGVALYALRTLAPAGATRDIDPDFFTEVMRIRYEFVLVDLPAAYAASETLAEARERAMEKATFDLFGALGIPNEFIPGDSGIRDETATVIDIICEFGPSTGRRSFEVALPSS